MMLFTYQSSDNVIHLSIIRIWCYSPTNQIMLFTYWSSDNDLFTYQSWDVIYDHMMSFTYQSSDNIIHFSSYHVLIHRPLCWPDHDVWYWSRPLFTGTGHGSRDGPVTWLHRAPPAGICAPLPWGSVGCHHPTRFVRRSLYGLSDR